MDRVFGNGEGRIENRDKSYQLPKHQLEHDYTGIEKTAFTTRSRYLVIAITDLYKNDHCLLVTELRV
ncbi:MAG TPA: hypothetical protein V6C85_30145 [Allocoleopsis sp.]